MRSGFEIFRLADERTPNRPAIVDRGAGRELSYGDLADEIETVAAGFAARGVGRSSRRAVGRTRMVRDAADLGGALARAGALSDGGDRRSGPAFAGSAQPEDGRRPIHTEAPCCACPRQRLRTWTTTFMPVTTGGIQTSTTPSMPASSSMFQVIADHE